jgi:two-component system LytT family response regulator
MKKIKCLLVDDEPLAIALLEKHIGQLDFLEIAASCSSALKAAEILKQTEVDLMFLDIRMPAIGGIQLLKMLRNPPRVILTTAYREYALEGYDLDIVDYLLKPVTFERFFKAIDRFLRNQPLPLAPVTGDVGSEVIYLKSGYRNVKVSLEDILYIESLKDYVKICLTGGMVTAKYKISQLEAELGAKGFLRIHRSFIVNLRRVTAFTASDVEIGTIELPIGESYKELVFTHLKSS